MRADTVLKVKPALTQYLHEFDGCFGRVTARRHLDTYVLGQLGDLPRKSVEPIADASGTPPRTLQEFLGLYRWDIQAQQKNLVRHRRFLEIPAPVALSCLLLLAEVLVVCPVFSGQAAVQFSVFLKCLMAL